MLEPNGSTQGICYLGSARYAQQLSSTQEKKFQALASLGQIFVIGFSTDMKPRHFTGYAHFFLFPRLPLSLLRYGVVFILGPLLTLWCILHHNVRILVAQSPYEGGAMAWAKIIACLLGRRVALVVESHGDFEESLFLQRRVFLPWFYRFLMRAVSRFAFWHADLLRSISNATRQQQARCAPGKPQFQFVTWTDIEVFLQTGSSQEIPRPPNVLYAGVLTPLKGIHHLINAFAHLVEDFPQARLILAGREENKTYSAQLKIQVQRLGLNGQVHFIDQVPQAELAALMRQACVLVLPSLSEGLGRVLVEAMATHTPVIGSNVGGIPEVIEGGLTGFLVQPGDEATLTRKLRWFLEHPVKARKMGHRAHTFARQFFSTEAYVEGYRQVFARAQLLLDE